jgi:hypothetical protein
MPRLASIVIVLCGALSACNSDPANNQRHFVPLPLCDWPIPGELRLHVEEMTGHSYFQVRDVRAQRVTFRPIPEALAGDDSQSSVWKELRLLDEIGAARLFGHRLTVISNHGPQLIDADVDVYTVFLDDVMITAAGFSLPEVRSMVEHCNDSRKSNP